MNLKRLLSLILAVALAAGLMAAAEASAPVKKATVMIYMCGTDLESKNHQGTSTLTEINRTSGIDTDEVNAVALLGGSASWALGYDAQKLTLAELGGRRTAVVDELPMAYMSEPQTLTDFIDLCYERYPAESYYLVIWDHGGGPNIGMCHDFWSDDMLTTQGLAQALKNSAAARDRLDGILFHACLMDSMEVASLVAPYAKYMVATEESMYGLQYQWLGALSGGAAPFDALKVLVDDTWTFNNGVYAAQGDEVINTVSLIDLDRMAAVTPAMDAFFKNMTASVDDVSFSAVSGQRRDSAAFGMGESGGNSCYDLVDLGSLVSNLRDYAPAEADALLRAIDEAVPYQRTTDASCRGMTVYHPFYNKDRAAGWMSVHNTLGVSEGYSGYIQQFAAILTGTPLADWTGLRTDVPGASKDNRVLFNLGLTDEQTAHYGESSLDVLRKNEDGSYTFTYQTRDTAFEDGRLSAQYSGTALFVTDAEGNIDSFPLQYALTKGGIYQIPATLSRAATEDTEEFTARAIINCTLDPATKVLTPGSVLIYDEAGEGYTNIYNVAFQDFTSVTLPSATRVETRDENGVLKPFAEWEEETEGFRTMEIGGDWAFTLVNDAFDTAELYATFQVTSSQNSVYSSELKRVKPEGIAQNDLFFTYDDLGLVLISKGLISPIAGALTMTLTLTNLTETEAIVSLENLTVNGQALDLTGTAYGMGENWGLLPGEEQLLTLNMPGGQIADLSPVTDIAFTLVSRDAADDTVLGEVPVAVQTNIDVSGL